MLFLYNIGIRIYFLFILLASPVNKKARLWISGRKGLVRRIGSAINTEDHIIWFHCSSLGEFEQGRPVMEKIREELPGKKILLTFFSPSGYEIRKNYTGADYVFYLPLDTAKNAEKFLDLTRPEIVFFIKYEYWYHYLSTLNRRGIKTYLISGRFRSDQIFFKRYGKWYRKMLKLFCHLFIQDDDSAGLLKSTGIENFTVSGDTRFDRVFSIARKVTDFPLIRNFSEGCPTLIAGSTWPEDEKIITRFINENKFRLKFIIVPHEIHDRHVGHLQEIIQLKTIRYTSLNQKEIHQAAVLIIDTIGILSSIYQYGTIAYIGGGFGRGIHNTLEAAVFGLPVIFGPNYKNFREAVGLLNHHGGFTINDYRPFSELITQLINNETLLKTTGDNARAYARSGLGATDKIINFVLTK